MKHDGQAVLRSYVGNSLAGERRVYCCGYSSAGEQVASAYWPHRARFCPTCGEIWSREIYSYEFDYQPIPQDQWKIETKPCPKHGDWFLYEQPLEGLNETVLRQIFNGLMAQQGVMRDEH